MKGGLVLNCFALKALKRIGPLPFPVQILYTGDEEIGSASARVHIEKYARQARAVLNPEPGRASGNVVSARKGGATLIIEVSGRAAHSGVNHADGVSAIQALAHKVIKLHALTDYAAGITTNVGLISGGTSSNTVAPSATAKLDVRFVELRQWDEILSAVQSIVAEEELPGTSARLLEATTFFANGSPAQHRAAEYLSGPRAGTGFQRGRRIHRRLRRLGLHRQPRHPDPVRPRPGGRQSAHRP